ncbi:MAG: MerR family transcriptional regulator [Deltaproteobacteria bacterium]|nr:MAG: MerR family transcriptional regulator [Deltaproteobacteria bacterium]
MIRRPPPGAHSWTDDATFALRACPDDALSARSVARELATAGAVEAHAASGGGRGGAGGRRAAATGRRPALLTEAELREVEAQYADGITAAQIVDIFVSRGIRLSEATFRKYVQQGLLPRSRRVGRKGKHRGSLGVYPAKTVRRINEIKRLMRDDYTIEQIQQRYLRFTNALESLEDVLADVFARFEDELQSERFDAKARRALKKDISDARKAADELLRRLDALQRRASEEGGDRYRDSGAAGSAEDLL